MVTSRLFGPCGHGIGPCGAVRTRPYPCGPRCVRHSPSALAGEPEPGTPRLIDLRPINTIKEIAK